AAGVRPPGIRTVHPPPVIRPLPALHTSRVCEVGFRGGVARWADVVEVLPGPAHDAQTLVAQGVLAQLLLDRHRRGQAARGPEREEPAHLTHRRSTSHSAGAV